MAKRKLNNEFLNSAYPSRRPLSVYQGQCFMMATKHQKSNAFIGPFQRLLGAGVMECYADTDKLGTFTSEILRQKTALKTAEQKCKLGLKHGGTLAIATEASFGNHPVIPFLPGHQEVVYLIDQQRKFKTHLTEWTTQTNYHTATATTLAELQAFAKRVHFPSHGIIVRAQPHGQKGLILKDFLTQAALEEGFKQALAASAEGAVWLETDMRAHMNPTRMAFIEHLAEKLALRLQQHCPSCDTPGWGKVDVEGGLPCELCNHPTGDIKTEIFGCPKCRHREHIQPNRVRPLADPGQCPKCNP